MEFTKDAPMHAFYSKEAECWGCSAVIWEAADGREVRCTAVYPDAEATDYKWPDKEYRGVVVRFLRREQSPGYPYGFYPSRERQGG